MGGGILSLPTELLERIVSFLLHGTWAKKRSDRVGFEQECVVSLLSMCRRFEDIFANLLLERCSLTFDDAVLRVLQDAEQSKDAGDRYLPLLRLLKRRQHLAGAIRHLEIRVEYKGMRACADPEDGAVISSQNVRMTAKRCETHLALQLSWLFQACTGLVSLHADFRCFRFFKATARPPLALALPASLQQATLIGDAACLLFPYLRTFPHWEDVPTRRLRKLALRPSKGIYHLLKDVNDRMSGPNVGQLYVDRDLGCRSKLEVDVLQTSDGMHHIGKILELVLLRPRTIDIRSRTTRYIWDAVICRSAVELMKSLSQFGEEEQRVRHLKIAVSKAELDQVEMFPMNVDFLCGRLSEERRQLNLNFRISFAYFDGVKEDLRSI